MAVDLFISYSHQDRELRAELAKHLGGLRNQGVINDWYDGDIIEGTEWEKELIEHLNTAHVILLLVSADFIASKFCYNIEMKRALARHDAHQARVIPIILRPTDWKSTPFAKLKALPTDGKAVVLWGSHDDAFVDVVKCIKRAIRSLHDSASRAQGKDEADKLLLDTDDQDTNDQNASADAQPAHSKHTRIINRIGSIKGHGHIVNQGETQHTTITHHYGPRTPDDPQT